FLKHSSMQYNTRSKRSVNLHKKTAQKLPNTASPIVDEAVLGSFCAVFLCKFTERFERVLYCIELCFRYGYWTTLWNKVNSKFCRKLSEAGSRVRNFKRSQFTLCVDRVIQIFSVHLRKVYFPYLDSFVVIKRFLK